MRYSALLVQKFIEIKNQYYDNSEMRVHWGKINENLPPSIFTFLFLDRLPNLKILHCTETQVKYGKGDEKTALKKRALLRFESEFHVPEGRGIIKLFLPYFLK